MKESGKRVFGLEEQAYSEGFSLVGGGDEAGRGPWAGPVFASIVVLPRDYNLPGLDDSKKLSRLQRRSLFQLITKNAVSFGIGQTTHDEIDRLNILEATKLAFQRAFEGMPRKPDYLLLDHITLPWLKIPSSSFPKGESKSDSIAAASIIAKESRDLFMEEMEKKYPGYGFGKHMGYGTAFHQDALQRLGISPIHRLSFKPVKKVIGSFSGES